MVAEIKDYEDYNKASESYDQSGRIPVCVNRIISHLPTSCSILDAGCGTGNYLLPLIKSGKIVKYTGIEGTQGMLSVARKKAQCAPKNVDINLIQGDLLKKLPFDNNAFDAIIINQVLHHLTDINQPTREKQLENVQNLLHEFRRVLKNGGVLCINTTSHSQNAALWYVSLVLTGEKVDRLLKRVPDVSELKKLLLKAGFINVDTVLDKEPTFGEKHFEYEQAFDADYRKGDSTFVLASSEEIEDALSRLRELLKDRDSYDKKERDIFDKEGCTTEIFAV